MPLAIGTKVRNRHTGEDCTIEARAPMASNRDITIYTLNDGEAWRSDELVEHWRVINPTIAAKPAAEPYGDSPEGHDDAMLADEARDAMRNLPLVEVRNIGKAPPLRGSFENR